MGIEKAGLQLGKEIIAWARTGAGKSLLATKPVKINTAGLKLAPKLEGDVVNFTTLCKPPMEKLKELKISEGLHEIYLKDAMGKNMVLGTLDAPYITDNNSLFLKKLIELFPKKAGNKVNIDVQKRMLYLQDINHSNIKDKEEFLKQFLKDVEEVENMKAPDSSMLYSDSTVSLYSKKAILQAKYNNPERYQDIMNLYDLYKQRKAPRYALATLFPECCFHKLPKSDMNKLLNGENYYPKLSSLPEDSISKIETGDVFSVGEKMFVKTSSGYEKLKIDAKTYEKLFPPIERYTLSQGPLGNCHLMSAMDSIIKNPEGRIEFYKMFEQVENGVKCTIPGYKNSGIVYNFDDLSMLYTETNMKGSLGHKMIEHTYAKNHYDYCLQSQTGWRVKQMTQGATLKIFDFEGDYENVADHIKNLLGKMSETIDHRSGELLEKTIIDSALKKQKGIAIVNCLSHNNLKKGIIHGHFYNADLNSGNIINPWNTMEEIYYNPFDLSDITYAV